MRYALRVVLLLAATAPVARGAVFQYAVTVVTSRGDSTAFLWIPPAARQVRGVVMGGMTLMERELAKDERIREACAREQLAIVFLKCGLGRVDVDGLLSRLAEVSGYDELSAAPLFFVGHSAGGPQAKALAIELAPRCFGLVQYRGGVPGGEEPVPPGVPVLMMVGQFDEFGGTMRNQEGRETWEGGRDALAAFRAADERNLASIVVEPGAGHFAWSDRNAAYLALFLRKAAQSRIPEEWQVESVGPPALERIDHRSGWLTPLIIRKAGDLDAVPWDEYRGEKGRAAWHFDREIAEATLAYHAGGFGRKDQFIEWKDPYWVDAGTRFFFTKLQWTGDGQTFEVHPEYAEVYPSQRKGRGPRWLRAGEEVGHSTAPILIRHVSGPVVATGPRTLRMGYDCLAPATERSRVTFMACSRGDSEYRYTEQVGMMPRGFSGLEKGKEQVITFPQPDHLKLGGEPVPLDARSDSGLPVAYYVAQGPAVIEDGKLRMAELPCRAELPLLVKVVAWQFGSGVEPLVRTATPVERTVQVER